MQQSLTNSSNKIKTANFSTVNFVNQMMTQTSLQLQIKPDSIDDQKQISSDNMEYRTH